MKRACAFGAALVGLGTPLAAEAQVADTLGLGPTAMAVGGSMATRTGWAAVHYNPGALTLGGSAPETPGFVELSTGVIAAHPITFAERSDGSDLALADPAADTLGVTVGGRADLGPTLGLRGLVAGFSFYNPTDVVFAWRIHPDDRPQWLFLADRTRHLGVDFGLGYRVASWLGLGASLRVGFDAETHTTGRVTSVENATDPKTGAPYVDVHTELGENVTVVGKVAPTLGALITPADDTRIALVWRAHLYVDDFGWTRTQDVPVSSDIGYVHRFAHYYEPDEFVAGVARDLGDFSASLDVSYQRWSSGLSSSHLDLAGRWGDTVVPSLGLDWRARATLVLHAGYRFVKSPYSNFSGPTNLLDNDQHVGSLGARVQLARLGPARGDALWLAGAVRAAWLVTREETKDWRRFPSDAALEANPGDPGYRWGGAVLGSSLALEATW